MRLTKKRLKDLEVALSLDDVLYEKFLRLNEELRRETAKLYRAKQIVTVQQRRGKVMVALQIEAIHVSPDGMHVVVR